ncbi:MAG: glycosyltransferase [Microcoleaceae cyanobacterium]
MGNSPKLVIGVPVYNGENYLREALESIVNQTFTDFKVIISDNASTDSTPEICREFVARDNRFTYYRQPENIGGAPNFNFAFQPGDAPYFKWAAHDDVMLPDFLRQCIECLDNNPSLSMVHSRSTTIDHLGNSVGSYDKELRLNGKRASDRFWRILWVVHYTEVFGVMRSDMIAKTQMHPSVVGSDRHFMTEMVLQGDVGYVEEYLFLRRHHPESFCNALNSNKARLQWFDPKAKASVFLASPRKFQEYIASIFRIEMPWTERLACLRMLVEWTGRRAIESGLGLGDSYRQKLMAANAVPNATQTTQAN